MYQWGTCKYWMLLSRVRLGYNHLKVIIPEFNEDCTKLLNQIEYTKLQWLQNQSMYSSR
jgi:hypothetical protein